MNEHWKPRICVWELTLACNQRCGHCGSKAGKPRDDELSTRECLEMVDSLAGLGCEVITLSGGEPTLRADWPEVARAIRKAGMIPNMVSNGYALTEQIAEKMLEVGLSNVAISIDGTQDVHDKIRGKGSFERTHGAIQTLLRVGMPVTVMTTVNTLNQPRLAEIYQIVTDLGVETWRCQLGKAMGHMKSNSDLVIKPRDLLTLTPKLYELDEKGPVKVRIGDSIGYFGPYDTQLRATSWKGKPQRWGGCQAGTQAIGIESNGGIKGCLSMQAFREDDDIFLEGNTREESLETIWNDPNRFSYNRHFSPDNLQGFCGKCTHRLHCRGGARCVAATCSPNLFEDPYCYYRVSQAAMKLPRFLSRAAAAASMMCLVGGVACDKAEDPEPERTCEDVDCKDPQDELFAECCVVAEYGVEPTCEDADCSDPKDPLFNECCVTPAYGVEPTCDEADCSDPKDPLFNECCATADYGVEPTCNEADCSNPKDPLFNECCIALEYGVEPTCDEADCSDPKDPLFDECCATADYGVEPTCDEANCSDPKDPLFNECCAAPEYGVEPPDPDCEDVCCDCDYGVLPDDVAKKCC